VVSRRWHGDGGAGALSGASALIHHPHVQPLSGAPADAQEQQMGDGRAGLRSFIRAVYLHVCF